MTVAFWVIVANLIIIALLIIVVPIGFRRKLKLDDNQQHNLAIGRQKLVKLKNQFEQQRISQSEYDEQLTELELILDDELSLSQNTTTKANQGRWIIVIIIPLLPIAAISLYLMLGTPQMLAVSPIQTAQHLQATEASVTNQQDPDINTMLAKLTNHLQQNPDDVKGWLMLGRAHMVLKKYPDAVAAFVKADQLQANDVNILVQYADALAMSSKGRMAGKPSDLIFRALAMDPEHTTGLWLAGMAKAEQGDYQAALAHWLKLQPLLVSDLQGTAQIQKLIAEVRTKADQRAAVLTLPAPDSRNLGSMTMLTIRVRLADDLKSQAAPGDTLFIYAQALKGMRMPLAIVRKQVKDLPVTVTLSDAQAMSPMAKLSDNKQVKILARIAKTGSAMPQTGDLLGFVEPVQVGDSETIEVVISKAI